MSIQYFSIDSNARSKTPIAFFTGELSVVMQDEEGREVPCEVVKLPNGIFQVLFTPTRAGVHKAQVYFADQLVPESPAFKVLPTSDPSKVLSTSSISTFFNVCGPSSEPSAAVHAFLSLWLSHHFGVCHFKLKYQS